MPRHHGHHGHHGGNDGGGHGDDGEEFDFSSWYEYVFGREPENSHDDDEEMFNNWYDQFMNNFWGGDENNDSDGQNEGDMQNSRQTYPPADEGTSHGTIIMISALVGAVILIALVVTCMVVVCCLSKKKKASPCSTRPVTPSRNMTITRHAKEKEAFATPYQPSLPIYTLPAVESTGFYPRQPVSVEVVQPGDSVPKEDPENPRAYIDVISPPPAYAPGDNIQY